MAVHPIPFRSHLYSSLASLTHCFLFHCVGEWSQMDTSKLGCWFAREFGTEIITCLYDQLPDYSPEKHRMSEDRRSGPEHRAGGFHCTQTHTDTHSQAWADARARTRIRVHTDTRGSMRTHTHKHTHTEEHILPRSPDSSVRFSQGHSACQAIQEYRKREIIQN